MSAEQFWIWAERDGLRVQAIATPFATRLDAERLVASLERLGARDRRYFISATGEELEDIVRFPVTWMPKDH